MRLSSIGYMLACVSYGAGLVHSGAIPSEVKEERSTDSIDVTDSTDAALRQIDWKIVRGGLAVTRDVILVASGASSAIAEVVAWVQRDSSANSCAPQTANGQKSNDGSQSYNFQYWVTTTGKNCDTTAQTKTVAAALDDAWDQVHKEKYNWACISLSHGGTWHGHLAVATVESKEDVTKMCPQK
ncbi:MAG: hypothetical protein M1818_003751 [Claussenomyces sp. TS43310]|nr:MAG: hypothetical protein M1818_003751 [Claussenomyces sp. TS43310]